MYSFQLVMVTFLVDRGADAWSADAVRNSQPSRRGRPACAEAGPPISDLDSRRLGKHRLVHPAYVRIDCDQS